MSDNQVFIGMGGNIGNTVQILNQALIAISRLNSVKQLRCSNYYRTSPVSSIDQRDYVNAVCTFQAKMCPRQLLRHLQKIECSLGKVSKPKDFPRMIDLDLLLYGRQTVQDDDLKIPHPHWKERLFVLVPMKDLVDTLVVPDESCRGVEITVDLSEMIATFNNVNHEKIQMVRKNERSNNKKFCNW